MAIACFWGLFPPLLDISSLIFLLIVFFDVPLESGMPRNPSSVISCEHCKKDFRVPFNRKDTAKYCSRQCKAMGQIVRGSSCCETCGKTFDFIATRANTAKYCSRPCYYKAMRKIGSVSVECKHCGVCFKTSPSRRRVYCSKACINKNSKETFVAKFTTVRKAMLRRHLLERCERCGYDAVPEILGVHHKDRNRKNNTLENLEVLCPNCHSLEHIKHIAHGGSSRSEC